MEITELPIPNRLLVEILIRCRILRGSTAHDRSGRGLALANRIDRAQAGWISYRPSDWHDDGLGTGDRKLFAEALRDFEDRKMVQAERDKRGRPLWARLTLAGEKRAMQIVEREGIALPEEHKPLTERESVEFERDCFSECIRNTVRRLESLGPEATEAYRTALENILQTARADLLRANQRLIALDKSEEEPCP